MAPETIALLFAIGFSGAAPHEIAATDREIVVRFTEATDQTVSVHTAEVFENDAAALARPPVWTGTPAAGEARFPRFAGPVDRLYTRFLVTGASGQMDGSDRYATDLSALTRSDAAFPRPASPKGLQCIVDIDDAIALGVKHAAVNVSFSQLFDPTGTSAVWRDVDGSPVAARKEVVTALDVTVKRMTDAGMRVNLILLNYLPRRNASTSPLAHPLTAAETPNGIGAFNLSDAAGARTFRGLVEILAERYSRPDAAYGLVSGYIVGNEVQSHYDWYNLGDADPAVVVQEYAKAVRVADLAVRRFHADARVFASLDHNWTRQGRPDPTRAMPGRALIDRLRETFSAEGDVPWAVAFHPYPENLGDPRTWDDETALPSFDTPRITFKNLEVLTAYLRQPELLTGGEPRQVILSEQGFHCPASPDGGTTQAAAFAYAFERVRRIPGIESFIYHRHVDHPGEGGLRLGLRENVPGTYDRPGRTRPVYDLYKTIDAGDESPTAFALPIVGVSAWDEVGPRPVHGDSP